MMKRAMTSSKRKAGADTSPAAQRPPHQLFTDVLLSPGTPGSPSVSTLFEGIRHFYHICVSSVGQRNTSEHTGGIFDIFIY